MKFTLAVAMNPPEHYGPLAQAAEEHGFSALCVPDSIFWSESVSAKYPYTKDGDRFWEPSTQFLEPWSAIAWMAAQTTTLKFYTNVLKLAVRQPLLVAKQVLTVSALSGGRVALGAGLGWLPEEFEWCGAPWKGRGARGNEALEILRLLFDGGEVEYKGEHFEFGKIQMTPAAPSRVPIYIGGHSAPALRRAAKYGDGWASAMARTDELVEFIAKLTELRAEQGRADEHFEIQAAVTDAYSVDGYKRLGEIGVHDVLCQPWLFRGVSAHDPLDKKIDAIKWFADAMIRPTNAE